MQVNSIGMGFNDQIIREELSIDENDAWGDKLGKTFKDKILIGCANVGRLWIRPVTKGTKEKRINWSARK